MSDSSSKSTEKFTAKASEITSEITSETTSGQAFSKYGKAIAALIFSLSTSQLLFHDQQFLLLSLIVLVGGASWYGLRRFKSTKKPQTPALSPPQKLQLELQKVQQSIVKLDHLGQRQILLEKANRIALSLEKCLEKSSSQSEPNQLQIALVGKAGVGKSSIIEALLSSSVNSSSSANSSLLSLPAFNGFRHSKRQIQLVETNLEQAQTANLVIMVVSGDLTAAENQILQTLKQQGKPTILAFNQIDLFLPSDRAVILAKLQTYDPEALAITAKPKPIIVRQSVSTTKDSMGENNSEQQKVWQENQDPQIEPLKQRLEQILSQQWEDLFYQNLFAQVRSLKTETSTQLNQARRLKSESIIKRYQWLNAGAIFISPMPALDLFASSAINGQLLIELGKLYDRNLNWEQAKEIGTMIGKNLWQLGCIELATTAIATGLKSHTFTFAIGGSTQAICAAYITKVGANSFLDYLELDVESESLNPEFMAEKSNTLRQLCEKNLLMTQGISVFTDLISSFRKINPLSNLA